MNKPNGQNAKLYIDDNLIGYAAHVKVDSIPDFYIRPKMKPSGTVQPASNVNPMGNRKQRRAAKARARKAN